MLNFPSPYSGSSPAGANFFPADTQHNAWRAELLHDHYGQATDTLAHTYYGQTIKTWHALEKIWGMH
jgi:hypothetical protein